MNNNKNNNKNNNNSNINIISNNNINKIIEKNIEKNQKYLYLNKYLNNLSNNEKKLFKEPIGLFDPLGKNVNPFTLQPYQNLYSNEQIVYQQGILKGVTVPKTYRNLAYDWTKLIVYQHLITIFTSIQKNQVTMIKAGTGVGKTVTVPKIALQAFNFQKKIVCTNPKKTLTISNSTFCSKCLDVVNGEEVGYFFMGENNTSNKTKLVFTTPGSLKSKLTGGDTYLEEYSCVILDEIHERSVETDQLLLYMKSIMEKRPDFRLVLMSATVPLEDFKNYFTKLSNFSYQEIDIPGALEFKVDIFFEPKPVPDWRLASVSKAEHILKTSDFGDILIFVKSGADGNFIREELSRKIKTLNKKNNKLENPLILIFDAKADKEIRELSINADLYKNIFDDQGQQYTRRIILATNVAESSITINGVIYVIDNGYALESAFYPYENARSLLEERISDAAANQRKGRAGRTMDGKCYRLYTEEEFKKFKPFPVPDIQKTDLTSGILDMFLLDYIKNVGDVRTYLNKLLSPPAEIFITSALNKLVALEAITGINNDDTLTMMGKGLAKFRVIEPNFAKAILASYYYHCKNEVMDIITIAECIDSRIDGLYDKFRPRDRKMSNSEIKKEEMEFKKRQHKFDSQYGDYITMLNIYQSLRSYMQNNPTEEGNPINNAKKWCKEHGISSRVFVNKFIRSGDRENRNGWDGIYQKSQKLNNILMKIVRPAELKKQFYNEYRKNGGPENIRELNKNIEIEKNEIVNSQDNIFSDDIELVKTDKLQMGGYNSKPFEVNFFPNAKSFDSSEKNILMALSIGNITNLAKQIDKKKMIYKTCFPEKKVYVNLDKNTTLTAKNATKLIMYHELFMARKDARFLKLNITTKIPVDVISVLKKDYIKFIKPCFIEEKMEYEKPKNKSHIKGALKNKLKDKSKKKFQGKFKKTKK